MYMFLKISFMLTKAIFKMFRRLLRRCTRIIKFAISAFIICFFTISPTFNYFTQDCLAAEEESYPDELEYENSLDTSKAQSLLSADFSSASHLCSVSFTYYCDNLDNSIVLYIEDKQNDKLYYVTTFTLGSNLVNNSIYYTKNFHLPNGEYNLYVGFAGVPLNDERVYTYMPSSFLSIHNNSFSIINAVITRDVNFLHRAKNIILLDPLYTPIVDDILSDILLLEQKGVIYTSEDIFKSGVVTQYNQYKDNKYQPEDEELFFDISTITPTKCEVDPSVDIYVDYYENLTNDAYINELLKEESTRTETSIPNFMPTTTNKEEVSSTDSQTSDDSSTSSSSSSEETTVLKPFTPLETESLTNDKDLECEKENTNTVILIFAFSFIAIIGGAVVFFILKKKNENSEL